MLVLLPPSEGKASAAKGAPLDLAALSFPALNPIRERLVRALVALGSSPTGRRRARSWACPVGWTASSTATRPS